MKCVNEAVVFGVDVPGYDGKAGMAVLVLSQTTDSSDNSDTPDTASDFDCARSFSDEEWEDFKTCCRSHLPPAARPIFVRFAKEIPKTETFKYRKGPLRAAGYRPQPDPVYLTASKGKESPTSPKRIDESLYAELQSAKGDLI